MTTESFVPLLFERPREHHVVHLAPRVQGRGDFVGEYGFALELLHDGKVRVYWDDGGGVSEVPASSLVFFEAIRAS